MSQLARLLGRVFVTNHAINTCPVDSTQQHHKYAVNSSSCGQFLGAVNSWVADDMKRLWLKDSGQGFTDRDWRVNDAEGNASRFTDSEGQPTAGALYGGSRVPAVRLHQHVACPPRIQVRCLLLNGNGQRLAVCMNHRRAGPGSSLEAV